MYVYLCMYIYVLYSCIISMHYVKTPKCQNAKTQKIQKCQNVKNITTMPNCQNVKNVKMPKCKNAKMSKCQNATMPKCQNVKMSKCKNVKTPTCQTCTYAKMSKCQNVKNAKMLIVGNTMYGFDCKYDRRPRASFCPPTPSGSSRAPPCTRRLRAPRRRTRPAR